MKKNFLLALMIFICCAGCSSQGDSETAVSQINEEKTLTVVNPEFYLETDDILYLAEPQIAVTENGYYYFDGDFLIYVDKETGQNVPACTQANCDHKKESCDAFYSQLQWRTEQGIWYRDGYLYLIGSDSAFEKYSFWRMKPDGTEREKIADLFTVIGEDNYMSSPIIHRGFLYYSLIEETEEGRGRLYRVSCEPSSEPEQIFESEETAAQITRLRGYGDGVFFECGAFSDYGDEDTWSSSIFYIDIAGQTTEILEGPSKFYTVIDEKLYYTTDDGKIEIYDWELGEKKLFIDNGSVSDISYDGTYIYLDNYYGTILDEKVSADDRQITCLTKEGTIVAEWNIPPSESQNCLFGDENYLWMKFNDESWTTPVLKAYSKSDIGIESVSSWTRWENPNEE